MFGNKQDWDRLWRPSPRLGVSALMFVASGLALQDLASRGLKSG